ncbi:hypothetical protein KCH_52780 [Kitasatospora cheerisanensis KCTC 2395]|uniref:Uncharacterized protein n=1 Tax=Kitasatospora cheerisanensis KCTC 2395 TaxID=1348663 RepID=A0A066YN68_9ACTN|nr:hypothetical protein KCH_52780 [Kitasatospora cheerisanensis KCTC 2395]
MRAAAHGCPVVRPGPDGAGPCTPLCGAAALPAARAARRGDAASS